MPDKACRYPNCDCPIVNPTRLCNFVYCDGIGDFCTDKPLRPDELAKHSAPRPSDAAKPPLLRRLLAWRKAS
ncbi:hypothetical protein [Bradyrhizobium sp. Leo121]|uniref:hypothetical protein n=1 Tax=Bradyrhizobium sp. Leo121 TaxID=1571195 RepID=UPI0010290148|nr:hypothetical protein [Bradyrhizobium sp. Leo121]RZN30505.1 hypothetical protein CWO90_20425 [Bradyrhizobium sp. Leo121]